MRLKHLSVLTLAVVGCGSDGVTQVREPAASSSARRKDDRPPVAVIDVSANAVLAGKTVVFDAGRSSDDVAVVRWSWDFGDGAAADGRTVTHPFPVAGSFEVTLVVTDAAGNEASATTTIRVAAPPATAFLPSPSVWRYDLVNGAERGDCGGGFMAAPLTIEISGTRATLTEAGGLFGSTVYSGTYDASERVFAATHAGRGVVETLRGTFDEAYVRFDGEYVMRDPYFCTTDRSRRIAGARTAPAP